jgi:uncharacterized protein (DUF2225 family)
MTFANWTVFLQDLPDGLCTKGRQQVYETKQKYQNLYQLLAGANAIYLAVMVYLHGNKNSAGS